MNDVRRATLGLVLAFGFLHAADRQSTFDFHSNFWVNLHHFLYEQATSKTPEPCDSPDWQAALDVYRGEIVKSELLSRDIAGINTALARIENAESLKGSGISDDLAGVLEKAAIVYKVRWWPQHNRVNLAWIEVATPLVAKYEDAMKKELAAAYQTPWPSEPIWTDVAEYASRMGAYTMIEPTHITISSTDPGNQAALEALFHEASHGMIQKVSEALSAELDSQNKLFQRRARSGNWATTRHTR